MSSSPAVLLRRTTCPHCWADFAPEEALWIAAHADLLGDPRLGPDHPQRFRPSRFDLAGNALDGRGLVCTGLACPRCHLSVPRALLETEPAFVSILGSPACGKSFFLAALTWELRRILPQRFALAFTDADPVANRILNGYEEQLFLHPDADRLVPVADLIAKTLPQGGDLYDTVRYGSQEVSYPRPFLFTARPQPHHPSRDNAALARLLCLYDNAGESFRPGEESTRSPVTQHLAHARLLLFLFDPTQDVRFRALCPEAASVPGTRPCRQETVLLEAAARVRRVAGLGAHDRVDRPLVVVLTKQDVWAHLLDDDLATEPWGRGGFAGLDLERIEVGSRRLRETLLHVCPEIVTAAEGFARTVAYIAVSALGTTPVRDPDHGEAVVRPSTLAPRWATVPLLYGLSRALPELIPPVKRRLPAGALTRGRTMLEGPPRAAPGGR